MDGFQQPPKDAARSPGNEREWLDACKGGKVKPGGNFEFEGMVTETLLLGNVACSSGQKLNWDRASLKVGPIRMLRKSLSVRTRSGWEIRFTRTVATWLGSIEERFSTARQLARNDEEKPRLAMQVECSDEERLRQFSKDQGGFLQQARV